MDRSGRGSAETSRRETLRTAGGVLGLLAGATPASPVPRAAPDAAHRGTGGRPGSTPKPGRDDFIWMASSLWRREQLRANLLSFARRHEAGVVYSQPPTNGPGVGELVRPALADASAAGVEPWLNLGVFKETSARAFERDAAARERHLAGLREAARAFDRTVDGGRIVLWQEAPVMGRWTDDGGWTAESVEVLLEAGPSVFAAQRSAIVDENPDLDVGVFVHFPYVVDSKQPEVFAELAARMREHGTTPDFGFTDFYRGWYEKDVGPDPADAAVRSLVRNAREHLGTAVYYLGQAHAIRPGHTPSAQAMRSNLRAALDAGADGVGWYMRAGYKPTTQGFDPFVPNAEGASFADEPVCTPTVARDRYQYAWAATLDSRADVDPDGQFDLWLHGDGLAFYAHRLTARTADGEWALLGDLGGYLDGDYPYADGRTAVVRSLSRERFVDDGRLSLRIDTAADADETVLERVHAMPWDPGSFVTAQEATELVDGSADVGVFELGRTTDPRRLVPGESVRLDLPVGAGRRSLAPLVAPDYAAQIRRLSRAERAPDFEPDERFDLWVAGAGLDEPDGAPLLRERSGAATHPARDAIVAVAGDETVLCYGLERERYLQDGTLELAARGSAARRIDGVLAMPYAGSACFRGPTEAARLLTDQPQEVETFAIATTW